jgi:hypothetical protein
MKPKINAVKQIDSGRLFGGLRGNAQRDISSKAFENDGALIVFAGRGYPRVVPKRSHFSVLIVPAYAHLPKTAGRRSRVVPDISPLTVSRPERCTVPRAFRDGAHLVTLSV